MQDSPEQLKLDWLVQKAEKRLPPFPQHSRCKERLGSHLGKVSTIFLTLENDVTPRELIESMQSLGWGIEPHQVTAFFLEFESENLPRSSDRSG